MLFYTGDKIKTYLNGYKQTGTVLECINSNEPSDVKIQGYRYYVRLGRNKQIWSITEKYLRPVTSLLTKQSGRDNN